MEDNVHFDNWRAKMEFEDIVLYQARVNSKHPMYTVVFVFKKLFLIFTEIFLYEMVSNLVSSESSHFLIYILKA